MSQNRQTFFRESFARITKLFAVVGVINNNFMVDKARQSRYIRITKLTKIRKPRCVKGLPILEGLAILRNV